MASESKRQTRSERTAHTTDRIVAAFLDQMQSTGFDGVTAAGVARAAGVTVGAIYSRTENVSELGNLAWSHSLRSSFEAMYRDLVEVSRSKSVDDFVAGATLFDRRATVLGAAFDLAIASLFDEELGEVVEADVSALFAELIYGSEADPRTSDESATVMLILSFFSGRALAIRATGSTPAISRAQIETIWRYWGCEHSVVASSEVKPVAFFHPADHLPPASAHLFRTVLKVLGDRGYKRATIARIARAAGLTPGAVLPGFSSKARLVEEAARALIYSPAEVWKQYAPVVDAIGPMRARAAFLAEFLSPVHDDARKLNVELARIAQFTPELSSFSTPDDTLEHTHMGVMFVACFVRGTESLPYAGPFTQGSAT